jgi:hypothetical protein
MSTFDSTGGIHSPNGNNFSSLIPGSSSINAQVSPLARSVPPTGMRLTRILGQLRVHLRSVAGQIGPAAVLEFVQQALRQDFQLQEERRNG